MIAEVAYIEQEGWGDLLLNIERILLDVGCAVVDGRGVEAARRGGGTGGSPGSGRVIEAGVCGGVGGDIGRIVEDGLLPVADFGLVEGPAVASTEGGLSIAEEVVGEAEAGGEVVFRRGSDGLAKA